MTSAPDPVQADALRLLASSLGCLDVEDLQALAADLEWIQLPSGEMLFNQGDPGNSLFILVQGRLRVFLEQEGKRIPLGDVHRGETVGEMALITGEPRSAAVYATRHSTLALLRREAFERFIQTRPAAMLAISRVLVQRLRRVNRSSTLNHANIAVVPVGPGAPVAEFCAALAETLGKITSARVLTSKHLQECAGVDPSLAFIMGPESGRISAWLSEEEEKFDYVIYQADETPSTWTSWCVRQADRVLLTARSDGSPGQGAISAGQLDRHASELRPRRELILLSERDEAPHGTDRWLAEFLVEGHHHVNLSSRADIPAAGPPHHRARHRTRAGGRRCAWFRSHRGTARARRSGHSGRPDRRYEYGLDPGRAVRVRPLPRRHAVTQSEGLDHGQATRRQDHSGDLLRKGRQPPAHAARDVRGHADRGLAT